MSSNLPIPFLELAAAAGLEPSPANVEAIMQKVSTLPDAVWGRLSPDAQIWFNNAADKIQSGGLKFEQLLPSEPPRELESPSVVSQEPPPVSPATPAPTEVPSSPSEVAPPTEKARVPSSPKTLPKKTSPGRGRRAHKDSATERLRRCVVQNLDASPAEIEDLLAKEGISPLPAPNTIITILYEARKILAIYKELNPT